MTVAVLFEQLPVFRNAQQGWLGRDTDTIEPDIDGALRAVVRPGRAAAPRKVFCHAIPPGARVSRAAPLRQEVRRC